MAAWSSSVCMRAVKSWTVAKRALMVGSGVSVVG